MYERWIHDFWLDFNIFKTHVIKDRKRYKEWRIWRRMGWAL